MTYRATGRKPGRPSRQQDLTAWLQEYVNSGAGGMRLAARVRIDGEQRGFRWRSLERAKQTLGFTSIRVGNLGSEGEWAWVNPQRLTPAQSIAQEFADKFDRYEKRLSEAGVTSKAQSRARIANGWLAQITETLFAQGKVLSEIRETAAKQDPYLTEKHFADIEEEFRIVAFARLQDLQQAKANAEAVFETVRVQATKDLMSGKSLSQTTAEMEQAKATLAQAIEQVQEQFTALEKQIGPEMTLELLKGQSPG